MAADDGAEILVRIIERQLLPVLYYCVGLVGRQQLAVKVAQLAPLHADGYWQHARVI